MLQDSIAILHFLSDLPIIRVDSNEIVDCENFFLKALPFLCLDCKCITTGMCQTT